jgi:hypothetical protein
MEQRTFEDSVDTSEYRATEDCGAYTRAAEDIGTPQDAKDAEEWNEFPNGSESPDLSENSRM